MGRLGKSIALCIIVATALAGCAPIIETGLYPEEMFPLFEKPSRSATIVLDASRLEETDEAVDPEDLKQVLQKISGKSGFIQDVVSRQSGSCRREQVCAEIFLTRLNYKKEAIRLPPGPPLGLSILYPLSFPLLLKRDYIKLELTVQADLQFSDSQGRVEKHFFLSEGSTGRANFFNYGEEEAVARLKEIAFRNFSLQLLSEF
jgi:hypothetical protein